MDRIEAILRAMPATRLELQTGLSLNKRTVQSIIERLHKYGWIHIGGWDRVIKNGTGRFVMRYKAGPGKDRKCHLKPLTQAELDKRRRRNLIATGAIAERRRDNLMRYYERRAKKKQNTWMSALFVRRKGAS